ncbi:MAG: leucyl/phenylalanyl-tRNA--protein transferase [Pirellulaceae bacterium]|nr:leucyl/phenylalanyl-tRNA--protein transferase [Pirellulaceae bacterium]
MFNIWEKPRFPPPSEAGPDGLLMTGGSLAPSWMMEAYKSGIFPMPLNYAHRRTLAWFSPDPRGILEFDAFYVSHRLARRLRRGEFQFTIDEAFAQVVEACAAPRRRDTGCWLTLAMQNAYQTLHQLGAAHSVEVWSEGELIGGVFGIAIGGFFAGESMFSRRSDGSKAALACLVKHLRSRDFALLDVQWTNEHTRSLGAIEVPRCEYLKRLAAAIELPARFVD